MKLRGFLFSAILLALAACHSSADTLYSDDLAWQLASPKEIRKITSIRARLRREAKEADPLFILTPPPFEDIAAAPNELSGQIKIKPKSWELPPWPAVDPPIPADATDAEREYLEARATRNTEPQVWAELEAPGGEKEAPSALLRPRTVAMDKQLVYLVKNIPEPFSLRRYYDRKDIFVEVAAYGGTTSFKAEEAFRALKEAATRQTELKGFGDEAFMTRLEIRENEYDSEEIPFAELEPGKERPELLDSGKAVAMTAPAFQDLAVKDLEGKTITYVEPSRRGLNPEDEITQTLLVVVAFYPDQAVTVSLALDERLGSIQDLIAMSMMVQRKLTREIKPRR